DLVGELPVSEIPGAVVAPHHVDGCVNEARVREGGGRVPRAHVQQSVELAAAGTYVTTARPRPGDTASVEVLALPCGTLTAEAQRLHRQTRRPRRAAADIFHLNRGERAPFEFPHPLPEVVRDSRGDHAVTGVSIGDESEPKWGQECGRCHRGPPLSSSIAVRTC